MGKSPAEMTVAALKKELEARGLDTKGLKAVLVARLEEAMGGEATGDEAPAAEPAAAEEEPAEEPKPEEPEPEAPPQAEPEPEPEAAAEPEPEPEAAAPPAEPEPAAPAAIDFEAMKAKAQAIADKAAAMSGGDDDRGVKRDREGDDMLPPDAFENPAQRQRTSGFDAPPAEGAAPAVPVADAPGAVEGPAPITLQTAGHEGRIIGRGGQNIMRMQDQYQVRIQVKKDQGITEVSGAGAEQCAAEIRSIMDAANAALAAGGSGYVVGDAPGQAPAGGGASRIIPCAGVESRIIGKGGQNIRALRERTGAQIKVRNETRDVEITGHPQAVEAAAAAIEEIIHNFNTTGSAGPGPGGGGGRGGGGGGYGGGYAQPGGYQQQGGYGGGYQQQGGYGGGYQQQGGYGGGYGQGYAQGGYDQGAQYGGYQQQGAAYGGGGGGGPAPTGATGLPPGWQELSANGQVYYWNTETNVTQYERPQ